MAANIQKFVPVDGAYRISSSEQAALIEFLKSKMLATGNRTSTGELSKKGVLTKVVIDGVDRFFKNKGKGSWQFDDLKTKQKSDQKRVDNTTGFTPLEEIQMDFLDEVQAVKDEYNGNGNDLNGAKTADKKLKAIFKKYRKVNAGLDKNGKAIFFRAGQYDPSKWDSYGWKEGKNREDYGQWKKDVYSKYQVEGSKGHMKPASQGGTNAATSLIDEPASSNYSTQDKAGTFRSDQELASATIAHSGTTALQEYILDKDPTTRTNVRFLEQDRTRMGTELDTPIEQIESEAEDNLLNSQIQAYRDSEYVNGKENGFIEPLQHTAKLLWDSSMDFAGYGALKNGIYAGKAILDKDPVGAVMNIANMEVTTISPLKETEKLLKASQL